jgi:hypothetical protein
LWQPDKWPALEGLAPFAQALADQIAGVDSAATETRLEKAYRDTLY